MDFVPRNTSEGEDARPERQPRQRGQSDPSTAGAGGRIPDELIDAFFDDDLSDQQSRDLMKSLRHSPKQAREAVSMQQALDALRRPVSTPDLTNRILMQVDRQKSWLNEVSRWRVRLARYAAVVLLLVMVGGAYFAQRTAPEFMTFTPQDSTVGEVVDAVSDDTAEAVATMKSQFAVLSGSIEQDHVGRVRASEPNQADHYEVASAEFADEPSARQIQAGFNDSFWNEFSAEPVASPASGSGVSFLRASFLTPSSRSTDVPRIVVDER